MTHYDVLQVTPTASAEVIRAAYRSLMKAHHPDAGGDAALTIRLNEAYAILSDPVRRGAYDLTIREADVEAEPPAPSEPDWGEVVEDEHEVDLGWGEEVVEEPEPTRMPGPMPAPAYYVPPAASVPPAPAPGARYAPPVPPSTRLRASWWRTLVGGTVTSRIFGAVWLLASLAPAIATAVAASVGATDWGVVASNTVFFAVPTALALLIGVRRARSGRKALYVLVTLIGVAGAVGFGITAYQGGFDLARHDPYFAALFTAWTLCYLTATELRASDVRLGRV